MTRGGAADQSRPEAHDAEVVENCRRVLVVRETIRDNIMYILWPKNEIYKIQLKKKK